MDKQIDRILELLVGYHHDSLSKEEAAELEQWLHRHPGNRRLFEELKDQQDRDGAFMTMDGYDEERALQRLKLHMAKQLPRRKRMVRYALAAAAVILLVASGYLLLKEKEGLRSGHGPAAVVKNDVPPDNNKAVLTLADGKKIILDSNTNIFPAQQGNVQVIRPGAGQLAYKVGNSGAGTDGTERFNTLTTPAGIQYRVVLPDGSKVWLNAGSSLRYPVAFTAGERIVVLRGEAYFEVAKDEQKPFVIHAGRVRTRVLGTSLDVCAYPAEDNTQVAVVSGKVEVGISTEGDKTKKVILKANQMATCAKSTMELQRRNIADASDYASWRKGQLLFHHTLISDVVCELQRVYDIKFILRNKAVNNCVVSGSFEVHQPVEQIIKSICLSIGAHYEWRDNQIIISGPGCK